MCVPTPELAQLDPLKFPPKEIPPAPPGFPPPLWTTILLMTVTLSTVLQPAVGVPSDTIMPPLPALKTVLLEMTDWQPKPCEWIPKAEMRPTKLLVIWVPIKVA